MNWVGLPFYAYFVESSESEPVSIALGILVVSALLLVLFKVFLFIAVLLSLLDKPVPVMVKRGLLGLSGLVLFTALSFLSKDFQSGTLAYSRPFFLILGALIVVVDSLAIGYFLSKSYQLENADTRDPALHFGWAYFIGYVVYSTPFYASHWLDEPRVAVAVPFLYYLMHFPPMLFLKRLCESREPGLSGAAPLPRDLASVAEKYGISDREAAVLELVLAGKKNEDVAKQLFVSPHTVRNHIYSIYKKMDVKNRVQLISACSKDRPSTERGC